MPDYLRVIVVDFDNTICGFSEDFECSRLVPGATEAIVELKARGFTVVISSARSNAVYGGADGDAHKRMCDFLDLHNVPYDRVDSGADGKPVAFRYVDDKAVGCPITEDGAVDWEQVLDMIGELPDLCIPKKS